ncbi:fluoride efflux transporter CrcB [Staphylococcus intermedius]|uniref:Fluoride-specific ion channel FluC n=1 Tax=Staphylococcus intermedius NCTC 11048 TaxID=1141106 RepID=A0A380G7B0_STAIN|nr:fluoride efflux transporter CrcB [Staphylococcus intermedius]PCF64597.1 chromosome condensation protein CrcB [Staphylococcus intermedius]PCF80207.1 chromosome condensation protein CrcB [Staphylococcus intermedius]PCF81557.1 chromosome condensation protein CrcB [Staphylococcus intermedius]PCF84317.1 chromosome condensation protein CrcB [Staphylococcus intermedius]PCF86423.1 chromosome condensation protein CrcB [Staphylococcus intermedius]
MNILFVALGGGIGAVLRALISATSSRLIKSSFPIATLIVNLMGAFCIGYCVHFAWLSPDMKLFIVTGLLGGFTTFSTLTLELFQMLNSKLWISFFIYSTLQYVGCFVFCFLGMQL